MTNSLAGFHALVGGSTDGIGKATAFALAEAGATVTLLARNEWKLQQVCRQLPTPLGQNHDFFVADFLVPAQVQAVAQHIQQSDKIFHILVNNTGGPPPMPAIEANIAAYQQAFAQHVLNYQVLAQAVVEGMKKVQYGRIVNITSISVKEPLVGLGVSNTVRAAVSAWAKTLSKELGKFGITVNNILPGYIRTQRLESLLQQRAIAQQKPVSDIEKDLLCEVPVGRIGQPEEIAAAIAFLVSPAAAYINGINLPIDGGKLNAL